MIGELLTKYGSDKESVHHYGKMYESIFNELPDDLTLLEFGVYKGASLRAWREYRPKSKIYACDCAPAETTENFAYCNLQTLPFKDIKFDLIIDDSAHFFETMMTVISNYLGNLKPHGIMVIEDIREMDWISHFERTIKDNKRTSTLVKTSDGIDDYLLVIR